MRYIEISGKPRPFKFNLSGIKELERLTGRGFFDFVHSLFPSGEFKDEFEAGLAMILNMKTSDMVHVIYAGLYGGAKAEKQPLPTEQEVIDLLDELDNDQLIAKLTEAITLLIESMPKSDNSSNPQASGEKKRG